METHIYGVKIAKFYTGTRIEAYHNEYFMFTNKDKALKFAFEKAKEYSKTIKNFNDKGQYYVKGSGGYEEWPNYISTIEELNFDGNSDIAATLRFSDGEWWDIIEEMNASNV